MQWSLSGAASPEDLVELVTAGDGDWVYRVLVRPGTRRPVRDHQGCVVYLPVSRVVGDLPPG